MALNATLVVVSWRWFPLLADRFMRVMAVDASQGLCWTFAIFCQRVAMALRGVAIFGRIPGRHAAGKIRPLTRVAAGAGPIDVLRRAPEEFFLGLVFA